jgi:hypothetical protein
MEHGHGHLGQRTAGNKTSKQHICLRQLAKKAHTHAPPSPHPPIDLFIAFLGASQEAVSGQGEFRGQKRHKTSLEKIHVDSSRGCPI